MTRKTERASAVDIVRMLPQRYDPRFPLAELEEYPGNPKEHDIALLHQSVDASGFFGALLVQEWPRTPKYILAGHGRKKTLLDKGITHAPVLFIECDPATARRIVLVDNRAVQLGGFDDKRLASMLAEIAQDDVSHLLGTGYTTDDVQRLTSLLSQPYSPLTSPDLEAIPDVPKKPITKLGDIIECGDHIIICGDCRIAKTWDAALAGRRVHLAFTSPPYAEQRKYDESSGFKPIPPDKYVAWFKPIASNVQRVLAKDGSWFVNIKPGCLEHDTFLYVFDLVIAHVREWGWHFGTEFCWERNGVPKAVTQRFKNQFEPIYQFALGRWKMRPDAVRHLSDNVPINMPGVGNTSWKDEQGGRDGALGAKKRKTGTKGAGASDKHQGTNWSPGEYIQAGLAYPGNRLPTFSSSHEATGHTAAFPVGLPDFFIRAYTDEGDVIADPFAGSGSTMIASELTKRASISIELSPGYCDVMASRWERVTGRQAVRRTRAGKRR